MAHGGPNFPARAASVSRLQMGVWQIICAYASTTPWVRASETASASW